mgnify:CR=1 FL=1
MRRRGERPCDPVRVLRDAETGTPLSYCLALEEGQEESVAVEWQIRDETNAVVQEGQEGPGLSVVEIRFLDGRRHVRLDIPAPRGLSLGYYNLIVRAEGLVGGAVGTMRVIVAPRQCCMSRRHSRHTNGCGDWRCSSIRCPPIVIGGAATLPISVGL